MTRVLFWGVSDASGAVGKYRIVTRAAGARVAQASGGQAALLGITGRGGGQDGRRIEFARVGVAEVEYGGAVSAGDLLTADADGKAVVADTESIRSAAVDGANANTNIAVAGILTTDRLIAVIEKANGGLAITDRTSLASITSNGNIQLTGATNGDRLIVLWRRPTRTIGIAEVDGVDGDIGQALIAPGQV